MAGNAHLLAVRSDLADGTKRRNGFADVLAPGNQEVVEFDPILHWQLLSERELGLFRGLCFHIAQSIGNSVHVSVHAYTGLAETKSDHEISRLSAHALEFEQLVQIVRDPTSILVQEVLAYLAYCSSLGAIEAYRIDQSLDFVFGEGKESLRAICFCEQLFGGFTSDLVFGPQGENS